MGVTRDMKKTLLMMATAALTACSADRNQLLDNEFDTPYNLPPFEQIANKHWLPAFAQAVDQVGKSVTLIAGNGNAPTFENTIVPLDRCQQHLRRLSLTFFNLVETDVTDTMNVMAEQILPMLTQADDDVYFNDALFARVQTVHDGDRSALDKAQNRVLDLYYKDFVRHGALLDAGKKARLADINQQIELLMHTFGNNVRDETNDSYRLVIDSVDGLSGLPENVVSASAERAAQAGLKGKWLFNLQNASIMPFLQYSSRHDLRKQIYEAYTKRCRNGGAKDNSENVRKLVSLRIEKAQLMGYKSYAHYAIELNMAPSPEAADSFLLSLWWPALEKARGELAEMRKFALKYDKTTNIEACDWAYWAEKVRKANYDVDETELSQYFELGHVREGLFASATKLHGVTFEPITEAPFYNADDNELWKVNDRDGTMLGTVYFDWHPRSSKGGGAWCTTFRDGLDNFDGTRVLPQVSVVCNFTRGASDKPALLTWDEVETMFHEFGHALQALFTQGQYVRTAGVVPGDYVEMPSQINEQWVNNPYVLKSFAKHCSSGSPIPDELVQRMQEAKGCNQGFASTEYLAAALLDLHWHLLTNKDSVPNVEDFERSLFSKLQLPAEIAPRYHSTYFRHTFNGGYSAGYYVYEWAQMLACDAFSAFADSGDVYNQTLALSFRDNCLAQAGNVDPMEAYVAFRGRKPTTDELLVFRGFAGSKAKKPTPWAQMSKPTTPSTSESTSPGGASKGKTGADSTTKPGGTTTKPVGTTTKPGSSGGTSKGRKGSTPPPAAEPAPLPSKSAVTPVAPVVPAPVLPSGQQ